MRRSGILGNFCGSERRGISGGPARGQFDVIKIRTAWGIARGRSGATLARCTRWARSDFRVGSRRGPEPVEHRPPAERRRQTNGNPESGSGPDLVHRRRPEARMARTRPGPEVVSRGTVRRGRSLPRRSTRDAFRQGTRETSNPFYNGFRTHSSLLCSCSSPRGLSTRQETDYVLPSQRTDFPGRREEA